MTARRLTPATAISAISAAIGIGLAGLLLFPGAATPATTRMAHAQDPVIVYGSALPNGTVGKAYDAKITVTSVDGQSCACLLRNNTAAPGMTFRNSKSSISQPDSFVEVIGTPPVAGTYYVLTQIAILDQNGQMLNVCCSKQWTFNVTGAAAKPAPPPAPTTKAKPGSAPVVGALSIKEVIRELKQIVGYEDKATADALGGIKTDESYPAVTNARLQAVNAAGGLAKLLDGVAGGSAVHDDLTRAYEHDHSVEKLLVGHSVALYKLQEAVDELRAARALKETALRALGG
jgi:hypothetical protein